MSLKDTLQITTGRINRRQYLIYWIISSFVISASTRIDPIFGNQIVSTIIAGFFGGYLLLVFSVKRVRDIGYSGWYAAGLIAALLLLGALSTIYENFYIGVALCGVGIIFLLLWPGDRNTNQYGEPPKGWSL